MVEADAYGGGGGGALVKEWWRSNAPFEYVHHRSDVSCVGEANSGARMMTGENKDADKMAMAAVTKAIRCD